MDAHFLTIELDNTKFGLAPFPECQGSCGIVPNGPAGLVIPFKIGYGLKC